MSSGLPDDNAAANSPTITAPAKDCNASAKCFSSATNTRSSGDADAMLATPSTVTLPSPTRRAPTASAISFTERFMAPTVSQQADQTKALRGYSGAPGILLFLLFGEHVDRRYRSRNTNSRPHRRLPTMLDSEF